jgi:hypothetical protein
MINEMEQPEEGSEPLHFAAKFAVSRFSQLRTILWKNRQVYWRYTGALCCFSCFPVSKAAGRHIQRYAGL